MSLAVMLATVLLFPPGCLGLLLWLTRLEETLPAAVHASMREPDPPPILAIAVQQPAGAPVAPVPRQRTASTIETLQAFSRSAAAASLGGSTNR